MKACIDAGKDFTHTTSSFFKSSFINKKNDKLEGFLKDGNCFLVDQLDQEITIKKCGAGANHILARTYRQAEQGNREQKLLFIELSEYLLDYIYWPSDAKSEIEALVRKTYKELIQT